MQPNELYQGQEEIMIEKVLSLDKPAYIDMVNKQQEICKKYTILGHLNNIFKLF